MDTITSRFIQMRNAVNLNKSQLAEKLSTTPSVIGDIETGRREPSRNVLAKLIEIYNLNINWLFTGNGEMFVNTTEEKKEVETVDSDNVEEKKEIQSNVATSLNIEDVQKAIEIIKLVNSEMSANYLMPVPLELSSHGEKLKAMLVKSDSMEPTIKKHSVVLFDMLGYVGEGVYVIKLEGTYFIKRITCIDNVYKLNSDNKAYDTIELPILNDKLEIKGQIKSVTNIMY